MSESIEQNRSAFDRDLAAGKSWFGDTMLILAYSNGSYWHSAEFGSPEAATLVQMSVKFANTDTFTYTPEQKGKK